MPSPSWRKNTSVIEQITKNPENFTFLQIVRLLERADAFNTTLQNYTLQAKELGGRFASNPVGKFTPPTAESMRFQSNSTLVFHEHEVASVKRKTIGAASGTNTAPKATQWQVVVNFIGLMGSAGVLPYHYTEILLQRLRQKDPSMLHFIDMFNHRLTSLFYQASTKYQLPLAFEQAKLADRSTSLSDAHSRALLALIGLGTNHLGQRHSVKDDSLIFFSGLFSQQVKTSTGLKQILQYYFDIPVEVQEFIGQWHDLIDDVRTKMPDKINRLGQNASLGRSTILGGKGWFAQGNTRIVLGPLSREQYIRFAPGTTSLKALNELTRLYLGLEREYGFVIQVRRKDIPSKIALRRTDPPIVGWSTWLSSKPLSDAENKQIMKIHISANRLK